MLLSIYDCSMMDTHFIFQEYGTWHVVQAPVDDLASLYIKAVLNGFSEFMFL